MAFFYHVTMKKATISISSCKCNFTSPKVNNLIIAKQSAIEVYSSPSVNDVELQLIDELSVYGKVLCICPIRLQKEGVDALAVLLRKGKVVIYQFAAGTNAAALNSNWRVIANGSFQNVDVLRLHEHQFFMCFDATRNILTVSIYDGVLKMADITEVIRSHQRETPIKLNFETIRIHDVPLLGFTFLEDPTNKPCIAALSLDKSEEFEQSRLRLYKVVLPLDGRQMLDQVVDDRNADRLFDTVFDLLIPVPQPLGGFLLAGRDSICYRNGNNVANACINFEVSSMLAWGAVDPYRYLIGDRDGNLIMVQLVMSNSSPSATVTGVSVECLGSTSQASSITYLDQGLVYVGSEWGDCQVIQLTNTDQKGNHFRERIWIENHGPIIDMAVLNREIFSQATMITLSGSLQDTSLRIIQNGVGIQERLEVLGDQWKSIWSVRLEQADYEDTFIINEVGSTLVGRMVAEDEMQPIVVDGLCVDTETRYCAMVQDGTLLLQAATDGLYFIASPRIAPPRGRLMYKWKPPSGTEISHCTNYRNQILVASVSTLYYLKVVFHKSSSTDEPPRITVETVCETRLEADVACLDMTPFDNSITKTPEPGVASPTTSNTRSPLESRLAVVCLWNRNEALLLALPNLELIHRQALGATWLARSVAIAELVPGLVYLLVALSNGQLLYCRMDVETGELGELRSITVGDAPMKLTQWNGTNGRNNVFVSSKYPCIVYAHNNRLTITPVNTQATAHMCVYRGQHFLKNCLALLRENSIYLVEVDDIKKMHTRKLPLYESAYRLKVSEKCSLIIVAASRGEHVAPSQTYGGKRFRTSNESNQLALPPSQMKQTSSGIHGFDEDDGIVYRPLCHDAVSLTPNVSAHTFAPKCSGAGSSGKKDFLRMRQAGSLLVYDLRDLSLMQVHRLSVSSRHYETAFSMTLCQASELEGMQEYLQAHWGQVASLRKTRHSNVGNEGFFDEAAKSTAISGEVLTALGSVSGPGESMDIDGGVESSSSSLTLLIVGTSVYGTETPPHGNSWFGRIHVLLWCSTDKIPHFETVLVKDISGTPYCIAVQHGCLLVGVNSSLRCYQFEEEQLKEVCDMYQDITLATAIEVKDNYILLADLTRSITLLSRKKEEKKFRVISAHKRPRWTTAILFLDAENFLATDVDLNLLCATRRSAKNDTEKILNMEVDPAVSQVPGLSRPTESATPAVSMATRGRSSTFLLTDGALFHLSESVNVMTRGSMRTATMDEIKYFSDSILYGSISGQVGYLLRIPDEEMFNFMVELEQHILLLFPSPLSGHSVDTNNTVGEKNLREQIYRQNLLDYREWREYQAHRLKEKARDVVDGNVIEKFLDLTNEQKSQIVSGLKLPKFLRHNGEIISSSLERDMTVDEMNSFIEQLSRNH